MSIALDWFSLTMLDAMGWNFVTREVFFIRGLCIIGIFRPDPHILKYCGSFFQIFSSLSSTVLQFYRAKTSYTRARLKCGSSWPENKLKLGCVDRYWLMENIKRNFNLWCNGQVMLFFMGSKLGRLHWGRNVGLGCFRIWCWGIYMGLRGTR